MSCLICEEYAKRISNLFRDEELREKFNNLTGIQISFNLFICDVCLKYMLEALSFREKCIFKYRKNHQSVKEEVTENSSWKKISEESQYIEEEHLIEDCIHETQIEQFDDEDEDYQLQDDTLYEEEKGQAETYVLTSKDIVEVKPDTIKENQDAITSESSKEVRKRKSYVTSDKLKIIAQAELSGNRQAGKIFNIDESLVRKWRLQKANLLLNQERNTKRKPNLKFPALEIRLKEFVENKIHEGIQLQPKEIKAEASRIAHEMKISSFKGSSSYIFKFMERYKYTKKHKRKKTAKFLVNPEIKN
jgi:transposase-like protein